MSIETDRVTMSRIFHCEMCKVVAELVLNVDRSRAAVWLKGTASLQ